MHMEAFVPVQPPLNPGMLVRSFLHTAGCSLISSSETIRNRGYTVELAEMGCLPTRLQ